MACLDLHYYVTVRRNAQKRSEKKEAKTLPAALSELQDNGELTDTIDAEGIYLCVCVGGGGGGGGGVMWQTGFETSGFVCVYRSVC